MGINAIDELRAYACLLELNVNSAMQVVGKRLGEIAKDLQNFQDNAHVMPDGCRMIEVSLHPKSDAVKEVAAWAMARGLRLAGKDPTLDDWLKLIAGSRVRKGLTPESVLVKEMADWWGRTNTKHLATQPIYDELRDLTRRAFNMTIKT